MTTVDERATAPAPRWRRPAGPPGRRWVPWQGRATRTDKALMAAIAAVIAVGVLSRPVRPFLIASHPEWLAFLTGDLSAIGATAAFARVGDLPLWPAVVGGALGMVKFDWLTWWAGRQWGHQIIGMFTASPRALRWAAWMREADARLIGLAVVLAMVPGVPTAVVYALAGWSGMRITTFLLLDLLGALAVSGLVAGLGYRAGQQAVDLVLLIDRYASVVSLSLIGVALLVPVTKSLLRRRRDRTHHNPQVRPRAGA